MIEANNPARIRLKSRLLSSVVERVLGLAPLADLYEKWKVIQGASKTKAAPAIGAEHVTEAPEEEESIASRFLDHTLGSLQADISVLLSDRLTEVPTEGTVIFCANHPLGGLEGMLLARLLLKVRPDLKVLTNELLTLIPEFDDLFIGVDVLSDNSSQKNVKGMKKVCRHLSKGGALLIFPAGIVSSFEIGSGVVEKPWTSMLGRLVTRYKASCMPLYVHGRNSRLFYLLGLIHPRLRTAMLARELSNKKGQTIQVTTGALIQTKELSKFGEEDALTDYLRLSCDALAHLSTADEMEFSAKPYTCDSYQRNVAELEKQLNDLKDCLLLKKEEFSVFCVPYARMGVMMTELAYSRERTFRAVGEGTGKELDSDMFDPHYLHLFIWDTENQCMVGSYRIGRCDEIIAEHGVKGLYSRSLFHYEADYIERIGQALEVGRSFVSIEYQRNPKALDLLWRGIGAYVANNPSYSTLFGCVSISREHSRLARAFLSETMLTCYSARPEFLTDVRPVAPLKVKGRIWTSEILSSINDIAVINKLLGNFDEGKRIPVLLRHYLALNGRFVSFSVNHGFNEALDGLILLDLRECPMKYLNRYLGLEGSKHFLEKWHSNERAA